MGTGHTGGLIPHAEHRSHRTVPQVQKEKIREKRKRGYRPSWTPSFRGGRVENYGQAAYAPRAG